MTEPVSVRDAREKLVKLQKSTVNQVVSDFNEQVAANPFRNRFVMEFPSTGGRITGKQIIDDLIKQFEGAGEYRVTISSKPNGDGARPLSQCADDPYIGSYLRTGHTLSGSNNYGPIGQRLVVEVVDRAALRSA